MMTNRNKVRIITSVSVLLMSLIMLISFMLWKKSINNKHSVIAIGLSDGQSDYIQKDLKVAFKQQAYIDRGNRLSKLGDFDKAIEDYKKALSVSKMSGEKGVARICIANAYEKKRDYKNALEWIIIARDQTNSWAKKPYEERVKYLGYALLGEYDLVIKHAEKAIKEYMIIHIDMPVQKQEYIDRLNDLIAAKDYILSLKKK